VATFCAADLRFDPETHIYSLPTGDDVPSVTAVLGAVGVTEDFDALGNGRPWLADRIVAAAARGSAVHADCHAYDDDDLVWSSVDSRVRPYVDAWAQFREDKRLTPITRERFVYHPTYGYAGTFDGIFALKRTRVLVDIKTGNPADGAAHLQTAAYRAAREQEFPNESISARWAVWLTPGRSVPYRIVNYDAPARRLEAALDFQKFLSCLTVYREQPQRRRRIV